MAQLRNKDQLALEKLRVNRRWDTINRLASLAIARGLKWGFFGYLVYEGAGAMQALAGKETTTTLIMSISANARWSIGISWALTLLMGVLVFFERRLRKGTVERLSLRTKELELQLDRGRSSSQLTTRGDTRPEDHL